MTRQACQDEDVPLCVYLGIIALILLGLYGGSCNGQSEVNAQKSRDAETTQVYEERGGAGETGLDGGEETQEDVRAKALFHYLRGYYPQHDDISLALVRIGDRWGVDPYLLMGIYVVESSAGKQCFNGSNCLGYGSYYYSDVLVCFTDVAKALAGNGTNGHFYRGKTVNDKLRTYNSANQAYVGNVIGIMDKIRSYE